MSPNTLDQLADRFINYLVVERGLSRNTVAAYSKDVLSYLESLKANGISDIADADMALVLRHLIDLRDAGLGPRSRARHLVAVRGFYRFLVHGSSFIVRPTLSIFGKAESSPYHEPRTIPYTESSPPLLALPKECPGRP